MQWSTALLRFGEKKCLQYRIIKILQPSSAYPCHSHLMWSVKRKTHTHTHTHTQTCHVMWRSIVARELTTLYCSSPEPDTCEPHSAWRHTDTALLWHSLKFAKCHENSISFFFPVRSARVPYQYSTPVCSTTSILQKLLSESQPFFSNANLSSWRATGIIISSTTRGPLLHFDPQT